MNFFKRKTTWTNGEFTILKICLVSIGICIGSGLHGPLANYTNYFLGMYIVTGLIIVYLWLSKLKSEE